MLFVSDSFPHVQSIPYWESPSRVWKLYIRRTCNWHLRYGEDFVLLVREELCCRARLIDWLILICAVEWKRMRTRQPSILQIVINKRKLKNVEYFNRLGCLVQYWQGKLDVGFLWQKQDSKRRRRRRFLPASLTKILRNKSVKWYIWGTAFCCIETVHLGQ